MTWARSRGASRTAPTPTTIRAAISAVGEVPAQGLGQDQRRGAGDDHGDAVAPLVGGGHGALAALVDRLDAPGVDDDVLGGAGEADAAPPAPPSAAGWRPDRPCIMPQDDHHQGLGDEHPRAAVAEQPGEAGNGGAVDQRRPDELEGVGQSGQAEEADHLQRQAGRRAATPTGCRRSAGTAGRRRSPAPA